MKILLTGVTGYIGKRLLPVLVAHGHKVVCVVRDRNRLSLPPSIVPLVDVVEADFFDKATLQAIPLDINAAYYLIHSMSTSEKFMEMEQQCAANFREAVERTSAKQVIYLSGIVNDAALSYHLSSRKMVEEALQSIIYSLTTLRAGIIIGSGSASFEIMRDLVEKLPVMITPKWLRTLCQPIGVADVIRFLDAALLNENTFKQNFDIGGPDILSYKDMLLGYAKVRGIKRRILIVPVMTPKLSSYWLYFITSTSYKLASALVDSMKVEVVCRNNDINKLLNIDPIPYNQAIERALAVIDDNQIVSSWKDAFSSSNINFRISDFLNVPTHGCFKDKKSYRVVSHEQCLENIWRIGGTNGWYFANWLWRLRGFIDKLFGGVGLRRGRTHSAEIAPGDAIDFWRVLYASKEDSRLLLFAEMKLPGEAWLELKIRGGRLYQTATFRPKGLLGRLYWMMLYPAHIFIFRVMAKRIASD
ncbi:MAG: SDR family oxidoreductase [Bacteroidales bacterium]|nr:SDR family oxidoreductase [Bacteroidales bacterium]MBN2750089.1 SDR family oxidoreductase [Bacteroidales bacterium]